MELRVRNVNQAYTQMLRHMIGPAFLEDTRNGAAYVLPEPLLTIYSRPSERILWNAARNANPIFHFMESLWMLAGSNNLDFVRHFNKRMADYSDDGRTLYGAYGYRWHYSFGLNQLDHIVHILKDTPNSRQAVLEMWNAKDLVTVTKDKPCNTHAYFRITNGALHMTVCCRSNDMVWGAYGTNCVHFSMLQEYIAAMVGVRVGWLYQFSNNFHLYKSMADAVMSGHMEITDFYSHAPYLQPMPMVFDPFSFLDEVKDAVFAIERADFRAPQLRNSFLKTAYAMAEAWFYRNSVNDKELASILNKIPAEDWKVATREYLYRNVKELRNV